MKITSVNRTPHFGAQGQDVNFDASKEKRKNTLIPLLIGLCAVLAIPTISVLL